MKINQLDEKGRRHGYWLYMTKSRFLVYAGSYNHGIRIGPWKDYIQIGAPLFVGSYDNKGRYAGICYNCEYDYTEIERWINS